MLYLIISDTHLGWEFSQAKFDFLKKIINQHDRVIIAGDFWEGFEWSFSDFLESPWAGLFPLLKKKKTIYLYGNHDSEVVSDQRRSIFSKGQKYSTRIKDHGVEIHIEHGHVRYRTPDMTFHIARLPTVLQRIFFKTQRYYYTKDHDISVLSSVENFISKYCATNEAIKKSLTRKSPKTWFICGHTHSPEIDPKLKFANTGLIEGGFASYISITDGKVALKVENY